MRKIRKRLTKCIIQNAYFIIHNHPHWTSPSLGGNEGGDSLARMLGQLLGVGAVHEVVEVEQTMVITHRDGRTSLAGEYAVALKHKAACAHHALRLTHDGGFGVNTCVRQV